LTQSVIEIVENMIQLGDANNDTVRWEVMKWGLLGRIKSEMERLQEEYRVNPVVRVTPSLMRKREETGRTKDRIQQVDTILELTVINECMDRLYHVINTCESRFHQDFRVHGWTYDHFEHLLNAILALYNPSMSIWHDNDEQQFENTSSTIGEHRKQLTDRIKHIKGMILPLLARLQLSYHQSTGTPLEQIDLHPHDFTRNRLFI
jgi:hypothetical protein